MLSWIRPLAALTILAASVSPNSEVGIAPAPRSRPALGADGLVGSRSGSSTPVLVRYVRGDTPAQADALRGQLRDTANLAVPPTRAPTIGIPRSYGPCVLHPGVVYLRKEYDYQAVGMKPFTKCNENVPAPTLIKHRTDLRYQWFNWWLQAGTSFVSSGRNEHSYLSKSIYYNCDGTENTVWSGTTLGMIIWQGNKYFARVYQRARELRCGARWP